MSENKYTSEDLKTMKSWSLERKIQVTQTRIIEWYQHFDGNVYVSFSGGKDSTVLLDLARRIYPDIEGVFMDTGLEYPEIRNFVKSKDNITWLKPELNFRQVIDKYGYPVVSKRVASYVASARRNPNSVRAKTLTGEIPSLYASYGKWGGLINAPFKISDACCHKMKVEPAKKYQKQTGKHPILATMTDESLNRKKKWLKEGCNAFDSKECTSQPMSFWTEQDVLMYLKEFKVEYASVYGDIVEEKGKLKTTGCKRTGCIFCCFGVQNEKEPNRFQMLKETHPQIYDYCMRKWENGGLELNKVLDYINVKY